MNHGDEDDKKTKDEPSDSVEHSTVVSRTTNSNDNDYWSASPYFLEILIPIISSFLLLRRRDLFGRLLLNLDKSCFSALCPSLSKREHLLKWAQRGIMPSWMPCPMNISLTLDDVWKDGSLLCTLINSAVLGACPNPYRHRNKPPTHGQALAYKYFGLPPVFTNEDFDQDLTGNLEFMFFMYLSQLRSNIIKYSVNIDPSDTEYTTSYIARGMGLVTGEQYKKCVFYLYPNMLEKDTGVLVTIKGPYHAYGCITLPPFYIFKTTSRGNKKEKVFYIEEDIKKLRIIKSSSEKHLFRTITTAMIPFLKNAQFRPVTSKIRIEANKEPDRIKLTYIPQHPGVHILCIVTDGCHLQGSPFNVSVSESDVEEIQKETVIAKKELAEKSNRIRWMNTTQNPLSSNRYFNKSTCSQIESNLFEKYNRINYRKFCKKFELLRSSFDERQEFALDSLEDERIFTNSEVKLLKRNSRAVERFIYSIKRVMKMVRHNESNWVKDNCMIEGKKLMKAICENNNTLNDQNEQKEDENEKIRYFEEKYATKQLGGITTSKISNILEIDPTLTSVIIPPKRTRKLENDTKQTIKSNESYYNFAKFEGISDDTDRISYATIELKELPVVSEYYKDNISSEKYNFNKTFEIQNSNEKRKLHAMGTKINRPESNSFFTITGTESEDDRSTAAIRSKKTITSESNNTSSNFSTECEIDKTKNAITEESSSITSNSSKEISEDQNMFTNEKIIKNITDKNALIKEELHEKTSTKGKLIFEGDQLHFNKITNAVENFKGIDIWENRTDGGRTHGKYENVNSVKMKVFTYDNSSKAQPEYKSKIDHHHENNSQNYATKNSKFSLVKNRKEMFDNKSEIKESIFDIENKQNINCNQKRKIIETNNVSSVNKITKPKKTLFNTSKNGEKKCVISNEIPLANNFHGSLLETSIRHPENGLDDNNSVSIKNKNLEKETEEERTFEVLKGDPTSTRKIEEVAEVKSCNVIGTVIKTANSNPIQSPVIEEENINIPGKRTNNKNDSITLTKIGKESVPDSENLLTSIGEQPINLSNNLDLLLDRVNNLIGSTEQEEKYEKHETPNSFKKTNSTGNPSDHYLNKIDKTKLEDKSIRGQKIFNKNNLDNNLDLLMDKIDKLINVAEVEEKRNREEKNILKNKNHNGLKDPEKFELGKRYSIADEENINFLNATSDNENDSLEIENNHRRPSSVLTMIQKFENPLVAPTEKEGNTEDISTMRNISYLENRERFIAMENPQNHSVKETVSHGLELNGVDKDATKSSAKGDKFEPSTPPRKTFLRRKGFFSKKSQSYPSYNKPSCHTATFDGTDSKDEEIVPRRNSTANEYSTVYIITERKQTEIRKTQYSHLPQYSSPDNVKIQEIKEPPVVKKHCEEDLRSRTCNETHELPIFSSIIKKSNDIDEGMFPDISGFLKENNRQPPHVDYPKDFSVSRRVSRVEPFQSLLAENNMYVTSQIHRSHPNIYFGENLKEKKAHKAWRKLKSFDANLLTASSNIRNHTNEPQYYVDDDNCTDVIIKENVPMATGNEGKDTSRIIKSLGTQRAERRSQKAVSNCQINQEGLHEGTPSNSQLSLSHPDGFPSVKDLRTKFEKKTEFDKNNSTNKSKTEIINRSLDPENYSCLDSSEEKVTLLNNSILHTNNHKRVKNIFSSNELANKNQSELTLTQRREDGVKENPEPHVSKSTSQHHFNGGCKQGTTSTPQYSFIKTPEATNSIRNEKKIDEVVEHNDNGKASETGENFNEELDVKNIMKNRFMKARNFFIELETHRNNYSNKRKFSNRCIKKKRKQSTGFGSFPKVSDKFPVRYIYKDVLGEKTGSFKGAANRLGVANAMASVPVRYKYFHSDCAEILPSLDIFHRNTKPKSRKSLNSIFFVYY